MILVVVGVRLRRTILPFILIGLAVLVIVIDDASFLGGLRPFDGGDDGLFYDGVGRVILQNCSPGMFGGSLRGGESVFYYGGPGLRYFRALEHIVFGESYLGYLSLILLLPFVAFALFRRFLPALWAIGLALFFMVPVGTLFGTTFVNYLKWASKGFADPAAYILFLAGILPDRRRDIVGTQRQISAGLFRRTALGARYFHETDYRPCRRGAAWRRRARGHLLSSMAAARRPVHWISAGLFHGAA